MKKNEVVVFGDQFIKAVIRFFFCNELSNVINWF
jgi:hypothetical protein